mgnify:CR=1 FL=1
MTFRYRDDDLHDIVSGSKNYKDHKKVTTDLKGKMAQFKLMTSHPFPQYCAEVEDKSIFLVFDQFEYLTDKYQWKNCLQEVWRTDARKDTCKYMLHGFEPIVSPDLDEDF